MLRMSHQHSSYTHETLTIAFIHSYMDICALLKTSRHKDKMYVGIMYCTTCMQNDGISPEKKKPNILYITCLGDTHHEYAISL